MRAPCISRRPRRHEAWCYADGGSTAVVALARRWLRAIVQRVVPRTPRSCAPRVGPPCAPARSSLPPSSWRCVAQATVAAARAAKHRCGGGTGAACYCSAAGGVSDARRWRVLASRRQRNIQATALCRPLCDDCSRGIIPSGRCVAALVNYGMRLADRATCGVMLPRNIWSPGFKSGQSPTPTATATHPRLLAVVTQVHPR